MTEWSRIKITDGTDQQDRFSPALEAGYFNVDELTFEELLAMGAEYASVISFFNLRNQTHGTWSELFYADEAVIMSMVLSTNLQRIESEFSRIPAGDMASLASYTLGLAEKVNLWFTRLSASEHRSGKALAQKIAIIVDETLAVELHNVGAIASHVQKRPDSDGTPDISHFSSIWRLDKKQSGSPFFMATVTELEDTPYLKQQLRSCFYAFFNAISYFKSITPLFLSESMDSQQHNPAVGLFIVFLKLYGKAQQKLNTFTQRHLDFYYEDVLEMKKRRQVPESLYLLIEPQTGTERAFIAKDTAFTPGKDESLKEIIYTATEDTIVRGAEVKSLATLALQHDSLISPESLLGYVTRIKSAYAQPARADANEDQDRSTSWPLFGWQTHGTGNGAPNDARIGFAVASRLLLLNEGVRKIDIGVELEGAGRMDSKGLLSTLLKSQSARDFTRMFGSLFAAYLLCGEECLSTQQKDLVISQAERLLASSLAEEIRSLLTQDWQGLFYKLFKKSFSLKLTTDNGWLDVDNYIVVPYSRDDGKAKAGLRILLSLGQEVEPITSYMPEVHGGDLNTRLPVLQCCINHQSHFYPYSVFQQLVISALHLSVDVKGLKNVVAYNQHGQLDPSTPFQPFGPLPGSNAYLVFGNYEIARKRLTGLDLNLEWGELPQNAGGFDEYYRGYQTQYGNRIFKGEFSALSDGSWQPYERAAGQHVDLFTSEDNGGRLLAKKSMTVDVLSYSKPAEPGILEEDFQYSLKCRNGFFRLSLAAPATAFGHAEYPEILTEVLTANARLKKPRQPPNPPYTPILNSISLDYRASSTINPALRQDERSADAAQIIHLHPFGTEIVHPALSDKPCFFLPQYTHDGNLFIGLSANNLTGSITLFFHLTAEVAQESLNKRLSVDWFYLTSNSWKAIPANRVLSDTTNGFLSSGIVSLNIPEDINRDNSVMPSDYYWLRAAVAHEQGSICRAYSVQANALRVIRESHEDAAEINTYPAAAKWTTVSAVPGISSIKQPGNGFGGKAGETDIELRTRGSERLRHKNRALVPWDYERLVLEQFPDIYKVKCFSNISAKEESIRPGSVLIVVVPTSRAKQDDICAKVMVGADRLDQIRSFVKNISSHFADIEVRNPVYEEIQVRCSVKFVDGISDGININRLNGAISRYICPWNKGGYKARFGWSIRQKDIESYIRSLNYVDFVTNFSMLHITMDRDGRYSLFDTAKDTGNNEVIIRPRYPWSLAIPVKKHFIETIRASRSIKAEITGVDELEVGSTFIISGNSGYGEEK